MKQVGAADKARLEEYFSSVRQLENQLALEMQKPDPLPACTIPGTVEATKENTEHEVALLKIYARLRPGNPPQLDKAKTLFQEKFFDENRYRLGRVGRFRINRKFDQSVPETVMTLRSEDLVAAAKATSTTSIIWATAGCAPSMSLQAKSFARGFSSSSAPFKSA